MRKFVCITLALLMLSLAACGDGAGGLSSAPADFTSQSSSMVEAESSADEQGAVSGTTTTKITATASSDLASSSTTESTDVSSTTTSRDGKPTQTTSTTTTISTSASVSVKEDKPVTYNTANLYNEQHSSYDKQSETMRLSILNLHDTVKASANGKTYYVSYKGNDANDGLTPATAWRTANRVGASTFLLAAGDAVLFERGGVYRGSFALTSGVSYGAYGSGSKPCIYGSPRNYADAALWTKTTKENVWRLDVGMDMGDVGNIVFDHGVACASGGKKLRAALNKDFDFYHDREKGYVYLYLSKGNPGTEYDDIEVCSHMFPLRGGRSTYDVTIENLCVKYTGAHAISFSTDAKNIIIRGCEIGYVGGSMQESRPKVRYGNGIEFVDLAKNITVENNWVYQCYDAGLTHQSGNGAGFYVDDITFRNNLVEYCVYNIEYFFSTTKGGYRNILFEGNILRFAGYGFGTENRIGGSDELVASINGWRGAIPCQGFVVRNNVLDTSYRYLLVTPYTDGTRGPSVVGNTWIQHKDEKSAVALLWDSSASSPRDNLPASNQATMTASITRIDKTGTAIFE